jgi:serine phosphatase RsbU (regulator of sigma subunit)
VGAGAAGVVPSAVPAVAPTVPFRHGLTFRQAVAILSIALGLGLAGSVVQGLLDWREVDAQVRRDLAQTAILVRGAAAEAAFQMQPVLASQVVDGLMGHARVSRVVLRDDFGKVLAERARPAAAADGAALLAPLFAHLKDYSLALTHRIGVDPPQPVGRLEIALDSGEIAADFLQRCLRLAAIGLFASIAISVLVVALLFHMITRPLLDLIHSIAAVDPAHPGAWRAPILQGHERDELALLRQTLEGLLAASQRGLHQRDIAEEHLRNLTAGLERRVEARTEELQAANTLLAREKEESERAFAKLDAAHHELEKANRLVVEGIRYARRIQTAMLPHRHALGDAVRDFSAIWHPVQMVSGDYYWAERLGDRCVIAIADCTGHGVPGAFITLVVASALDRILHEQGGELTPSAMLRSLDHLVRRRLYQDFRDIEHNDGLEAAVVVWDVGTRKLTFAGAGLPLIHGQAGGLTLVKGDRGGLGFADGQEGRVFQDHEIEVAPGRAFYLFTDGVPHHMGGGARRLFGVRRLIALLGLHAERPLEEQLAQVRQALEEYRGVEPTRDDMTLVAFQPL